MKIFNWMQSKLNGKPRIKKPSSKVFDDEKEQKPPKEEVNEWPHGLLEIGTLGNSDLKEDLQSNPPPSPRDHLHEFTPEEARNLQNELSSYLNEQSNSAAEFEKAPNFLPLNNFLSRQSSLKAQRTSSNADCDESKETFYRFQRSTSPVLSRGKDVCVDNTNSAIGKKSLSFLLKKVFVCRSGFAPAAPGLRDPIPESRIEKILRAILQKKIYPQSSSTTSTMSMKRYLGNIQNPNCANEEEIIDDKEEDEGSKWVKTDSEYIVLEI